MSKPPQYRAPKDIDPLFKRSALAHLMYQARVRYLIKHKLHLEYAELQALLEIKQYIKECQAKKKPIVPKGFDTNYLN